MPPSHAIDRPRCTDRQLLGVGRLLASYNVLRIAQGCALVVTPESRRPTLSVIPSEQREPRDLQPGTAATLEGGALPWGRPHEGIPILWETTFFFQRAKPVVVSPFENPFPTRGRGPWTPKGGWGPSLVSSHAIDRPRRTDRQLLGVERLLALVWRFENNAGVCFRWRLRFRVGDPSNRCL